MKKLSDDNCISLAKKMGYKNVTQMLIENNLSRSTYYFAKRQGANFKMNEKGELEFFQPQIIPLFVIKKRGVKTK